MIYKLLSCFLILTMLFVGCAQSNKNLEKINMFNSSGDSMPVGKGGDNSEDNELKQSIGNPDIDIANDLSDGDNDGSSLDNSYVEDSNSTEDDISNVTDTPEDNNRTEDDISNVADTTEDNNSTADDISNVADTSQDNNSTEDDISNVTDAPKDNNSTEDNTSNVTDTPEGDKNNINGEEITLKSDDIEKLKALLTDAGEGAVLVSDNGQKVMLENTGVATDLYRSANDFVVTSEGHLYDGIIKIWLIYADGTVFGIYDSPIEFTPEAYKTCAGRLYGVYYKIDTEHGVAERSFGFLPYEALDLPFEELGY